MTKQKNGRCQRSIEIGEDADGKMIRKFTAATTLREVDALVAEFRHEGKVRRQARYIHLEQYMMYYGPYAYSVTIGDEVPGRKAISTIASINSSMAFGYVKGMEIARRMEIV